MQKQFEMTDLGKMKFFLGIEVTQNELGIIICQSKYAKEILARFGMENCSVVNNPIMPGTICPSMKKRILLMLQTTCRLLVSLCI